MKVDIRYSEEERRLLAAAMEAANEALASLTAGTDRKYRVDYVELRSEHFDPSLGEMVPEPLRYLAASADGA